MRSTIFFLMILAWASPFKLPAEPFRTHRSRYKHQCHLCNIMMTKAKSKYLSDVISEMSDNASRL